MALFIEEAATGKEMRVMKIRGLTDDELVMLKKLNNQDYQRAGWRLLDILDERNDEVGTTWWRSDGVFAWWFDHVHAYVVIGR